MVLTIFQRTRLFVALSERSERLFFLPLYIYPLLRRRIDGENSEEIRIGECDRSHRSYDQIRSEYHIFLLK